MPTKDIEPKLKFIGEYLKLKADDVFCIPSYQRAYSWEVEQCDKLWQDIVSFIDSGAIDPYFFGTIIVDCSDKNILNLIDGQQRTTTFLLLLKALQLKILAVLRNIIKDEETEELVFGLKNRYNAILSILYKAEEESKQIGINRDWNNAKGVNIVENKSINELYKEELKKILEGRDFTEISSTVQSIPKKKRDNKYTKFFRNFKFFYDKLNEHESDWVNKFSKTLLEKCQIIEIRSWQIEQSIAMFNSLNSTGMPLTDADIISAQLYSKSKDQNKLFEERWEYIKAQSEQLSQLQIVDIDSVLQEGMYVLRALKKEYKENEVTTPGIRRYYIEYHKELLERPFEICNLFEKILLTWDVIKEYPIIKLLLKFNINSKLFLISYLSRFDPADLTVDKVQPIAEMLIRLFAVNEVVDSGYSSTKFKTFLFNENLKLVDSRVGIDEILEDFNRHIRKSWDRENIKQSIVTYQKNALVYLNEYLFSMEKGKDFDFESEKINIEHIMPASGRNLDHIRLDANIQDKNEFEEYVNKIGNKILLEENINKSISNDWFRTKKGNTIKDKMGYLESKFCLAQELSNYHRDMWQKEDIDSATERAANRILDFIFE